MLQGSPPSHSPVTTLTRAQHAALSETRTGDRHHIAIHSSCMQHVQLFPDSNPQLKPVHQVHQVSSWCPGSLQHGIHGIHTSTSQVTRRHLHTTHIITAETLWRLHSLIFCLLCNAAARFGPSVMRHGLRAPAPRLLACEGPLPQASPACRRLLERRVNLLGVDGTLLVGEAGLEEFHLRVQHAHHSTVQVLVVCVGVITLSASRTSHAERSGDANAIRLGSSSRPTTRLASLSIPLTVGDAVARAGTARGLPGVDVGAPERLGESIASR